jgi:hypothetical protein
MGRSRNYIRKRRHRLLRLPIHPLVVIWRLPAIQWQNARPAIPRLQFNERRPYCRLSNKSVSQSSVKIISQLIDLLDLSRLIDLLLIGLIYPYKPG